MEVSSLTEKVRLTYLIGSGTELEWKAGQVIKGIGTHKQYHIELSDDEDAILVDNSSEGPGGYLWECLEEITKTVPQNYDYKPDETIHCKGLEDIVILFNSYSGAASGEYLVQIDPVPPPKVYVKPDPKEYEKLESYGEF